MQISRICRVKKINVLRKLMFEKKDYYVNCMPSRFSYGTFQKQLSITVHIKGNPKSRLFSEDPSLLFLPLASSRCALGTPRRSNAERDPRGKISATSHKHEINFNPRHGARVNGAYL